jgi:drug/metabolite transporter (DMT)-like permease
VLFALGVVMVLTREDLRPLGLLLMVVSAVVFLAVTIARRAGRGSGR